MATSYQLDSAFGVVDGGVPASSNRDLGLPRFIDRILHASSRRIRFSVESSLKDHDNFTRHLNSLSSVEKARFNFGHLVMLSSSNWVKC